MCGEFKTTSMHEITLVVLFGVVLIDVDDSNFPAVNKTALEETSDASIAEVDDFDVTDMEGILLVVKSESRLVDVSNFDVSSAERTTLVVVCIVRFADAPDVFPSADRDVGVTVAVASFA